MRYNTPIDKAMAQIAREAHGERDRRLEDGPPSGTNYEDLVKLLVAGHKPPEQRLVNPTQWEFINDSSEYLAYVGKAGVAKTSTVVARAIIQGLLQPGSKICIGRRDYNDLPATTLKRFTTMLGYLPPSMVLHRVKAPPASYILASTIPGEPPSEFTFMGFNDIIGGHDYHCIVVDEADELPQEVLDDLMARKRSVGGQHLSLILAMNYPSKKHYMYTLLTGLNHRGKKVADPIFKVYHPQPFENNDNLPKNYHANLMAKMTDPNKRMRLVEGKYGDVSEGTPVYREFDRRLHTYQNPTVRRFAFEKYMPLFRFWDFGYRHPFCILAQLDEYERLRVLAEVKAENILAVDFAKMVIGQERVLGFLGDYTRHVDIGDIAVKQEKDTGSALSALQGIGINIQYNSMSFEASIDLVREVLGRLVEKEPYLVIDEEHAPALCEALATGYVLDRRGEKPYKDGFHDHPADAFRYGIWAVAGKGNWAMDTGPRHYDIAGGYQVGNQRADMKQEQQLNGEDMGMWKGRS